MGREKGYKTRQRSAILSFLKENGNQLVSAYDISNYLKKSGTPVGTATVYRYIDSLMSEGLLQKYVPDRDRGAVYQYIGDDECAKHFHLKCEICGNFIHMECDYIRSLYSHITDDHNFLVNSRKTIFYGLCDACRQLHKNKAGGE